jgi:8-amino-7-oxononanoate synthase
MVDEAHSLGVVGARGRGSFEAAGVNPDDVDIWMGTLSKTLAASGGYVCGNAALIDILKSNASGFVYSVGLAPALAASATEALAILNAEPERVSRLQANAKLFLKLAAEAGLDTGLAEPYAVVPVMVGDSMLAAKLSERILARGVNALPIIFPAVPMQSARLRFFISSLHEESDLRTAVQVVAEELERLCEEEFHNRLPAHLLSI